jgi:4-hydroxy-tetrahydrodipicolinate synthase
MKEWGRLITAMVTPFDDKLEVNYDAAIDLAKKLVSEGSTALVICGTTAEAPTLTDEEKYKLIKLAKDSVDVPIIAGVGTNCTATTIENGKKAIEAGADGVLVVVPYYNKPDQKSLYEHFKAVAEALDTKIMLYNVPGRTGINMVPETVEKLSEIENIVALKEACGSVNQTSEVIKRVKGKISVYTGDDALTLPSISVGAFGVVSVAAHVVCKEMSEMIDAYVSGNNGVAFEIHNKLLDTFNGLFILPNPVPVKTALNLTGFNVGEVRLPLTKASEDKIDQIKEILQGVGIL